MENEATLGPAYKEALHFLLFISVIPIGSSPIPLPLTSTLYIHGLSQSALRPLQNQVYSYGFLFFTSQFTKYIGDTPFVLSTLSAAPLLVV
uniref:Uncharacterized protein n=1 Tax=Xenopus tropicalis TaxID=8364 RepID=A0A1B8Y543_XENTR